MNEKMDKIKLPAFKSDTKSFQGVRFDVHSLEIPGKAGKKVKRDVVVHPGAVLILPLLDNENLVMIRNERFAVGQNLWELPAGTLEPKESPENTAKRELIEETGYQAGVIKPLNYYFTSPGICNEVMYAFVASDLSFVGQHLDESERITTETVSWKNALQMVRSGQIIDGKTIAALLYYHTFFR